METQPIVPYNKKPDFIRVLERVLREQLDGKAIPGGLSVQPAGRNTVFSMSHPNGAVYEAVVHHDGFKSELFDDTTRYVYEEMLEIDFILRMKGMIESKRTYRFYPAMSVGMKLKNPANIIRQNENEIVKCIHDFLVHTKTPPQ